MSAEEPEKKETLADLARGVVSRIGRDAPVDGRGEDKEEEKKNDSTPTAAASTNEMYAKASKSSVTTSSGSS